MLVSLSCWIIVSHTHGVARTHVQEFVSNTAFPLALGPGYHKTAACHACFVLADWL